VGSHTVVELLQAGKDVVIVDDLSNSSAKVVDRILKIVGLYVHSDLSNSPSGADFELTQAI
jgi:UDP-glucose 4-epimerase